MTNNDLEIIAKQIKKIHQKSTLPNGVETLVSYNCLLYKQSIYERFAIYHISVEILKT